MKNYSDYYVAFLDILGFKRLIEKENCNFIYSLFDMVRLKSRGQLIIGGKRVEAVEKIQYKIMSDSIVLYVDTALKDSFFALLFLCKKLQRSLANREKPVLLRGGIARGNLYIEGDIMYGSGLTKAYMIEHNVAKYPRIVFSREMLEDGRAMAKYIVHKFWEFVYCLEDSDELFFINYLCTLDFSNLNEKIEYFDRIRNCCSAELDSSYDTSIREKYLWLKGYLSNAIRSDVDVSKYYQEKNNEEEVKIMEEENQKLLKAYGETP